MLNERYVYIYENDHKGIFLNMAVNQEWPLYSKKFNTLIIENEAWKLLLFSALDKLILADFEDILAF